MRAFRLVGVAIVTFGLQLIDTSRAATWHVAPSGSDAAAGTNWATAKQTIQAACDLAVSNDTVLVSNGVYATGGRVASGALTNRVAITNAITVRSVNGPEFTIIAGVAEPLATNGNAAVRCVWLGTNATLDGFTLTNGHTRSSGDVNTEQSGGALWCATNTVVSNCVVTGSTAYRRGGGVYRGTLYNCTIIGNSARFYILAGGGGVADATLFNCLIADNSAYYSGGASLCAIYNSLISGNECEVNGGGAGSGSLFNCTVINNRALVSGGGVDSIALNNCIVYFNSAPTNANRAGSGACNYSCTPVLPVIHTASITNDPLLASLSHLSTNSPCIGAGSTNYALGVDVDAEAWANPPSMGCDEMVLGSVTGALSAAALAHLAAVPVGSNINFTAVITGRTTRSVWNFGDGTGATNAPVIAHSFSSTGSYPVTITAFNESFPTGVAGVVTVLVYNVTDYFVTTNGSDAAAGTNWATAKQTIQAAIDLTRIGDTVWVSNGIHATGGRAVFGAMTNRIAITNAITVRSLNGPGVTAIRGEADGATGSNGNAAVRCAYVAENAVLSGFTLTNGFTRGTGDYYNEMSGGGVWCATLNSTVSNCLLAGNMSAGAGGGSISGRLFNCTFVQNTGRGGGGGAAYGRLSGCAVFLNSSLPAGAGGGLFNCFAINCSVVGNSSVLGGGAYGGTLMNSIVYYNTSSNWASPTIYTTCTIPLPYAGYGNFTNDPEMASATHLSTNSPCIGVGSNSYTTFFGGNDMDGESWRSPPAVGCDEMYTGAITGALRVVGYVSTTNTLAGSNITFTVATEGRTTRTVWNFMDGTMLTNRAVATHAFSIAGDIPVEIRAFNDSNPLGVAATVMVHVISADMFVAPGGSHIAPFDTWVKAATNIQAAIDVAPFAATIWVSNGVYGSGGRLAAGSPLTNRVAITNTVTVRSVNGPAATTIQGGADPLTTNGNAAVRCVFVGTNATLSGFTLTGGHTLTNGTFQDMSGGGVRGALIGLTPVGLVSNCIIRGNDAYNRGGGSYQALLKNCTVQGNQTVMFSGAGGGAYGGTLENCQVFSNAAYRGGGVADGNLRNCAVYGNTASGDGGGFSGIFGGLVHNSTIAGNTASVGGGVTDATLYNSIVRFNTAVLSNNHSGATFYNSCVTPMPAGGSANITNDPQLASFSHIGSNSPCIGAGSSGYVFPGAVDIDGEPWNAPPSMGCDEVNPGFITGGLGVVAIASPTSCLAGATVTFTAQITGRVTRSVWDFADGSFATNQPVATHVFAASGTYFVVLRAFNETFPAGLTATVAVQVLSSSYFVAPGGGHIAPYDSWARAATNIQTVIDAVVTGATIWVSNGVYNTGGRVVYGAMSNRVAITKALTVRSVNGPAVTFIVGRADPVATNGDAAVRCVYMTNGASLIGFTLTNGHSGIGTANYVEVHSGGGIWGATNSVVSNCVIVGCTANANGGGAFRGLLLNCTVDFNRAVSGGGTYFSTLRNSTLTRNRSYAGAGAHGGTLENCLVHANVMNSFLGNGGGCMNADLIGCTVVANVSSNTGGGVSSCTLKNSIVHFNAALSAPNYEFSSFTNSCTTPDPGGTGNITNDPLFVNAASSNYHLSARSAAVNGGGNGFVTAPADLDGNLRIVAGAVDMGAYEFQGPPFTGTWFVATNGSDAAAGTSWQTALQTIQVAADLSLSGERILVSNGVYAAGGRVVFGALTNRVALTNAVTLQSANGPAVTTIAGRADPVSTNGNAAVRCVHLGTNASISGFTLSNGHTRAAGDLLREQSGGGLFASPGAVASNCAIARSSSANLGGGAYAGTLIDCVLSGNSASNSGGGAYGSLLVGSTLASNSALRGGGLHGSVASNCVLTGNAAQFGGGAYTSRLYNSLLTFNSAASNGGGAFGGLLVNCTLATNIATGHGGGAYSGMFHNCIVYFNAAPTGANWFAASFTNGCTIPLPPGAGNFTNDPLFVNAATGNFRLSPQSLCVDAASNQLASGATDLDGNARTNGASVDVGAYEFYAAASGYWLWATAITNGLTNYNDSAAGDGYPNLLKYTAGGSPTNADNVARLGIAPTNGLFALLLKRNTNATDVILIIERSDTLTNGAPWSGIATNVNGSWGGATNVAETGGANPVQVIVTDPFPATNRFLRQRVLRP